MKQHYRYQMMAALVSLLPLPLLLGILLLSYELLPLLPPVGLLLLAFWKPAIVILTLAIPSACGWLLAARAHFPPTFAAKFLPLLLPPLLYLSITIYFLKFSPSIALAWYVLFGLAVALLYGLFLLAFCFRNRKREPARERRKGAACLLLAAAPFCAAFAFSLHSVLINTVHGREDSIRDLRWDLYWGDPGSTLQDYHPEWANNVLALPSAPPSLRLATHLPRLDGRLAALPLYAAAFQAVACLDEDGRPSPTRSGTSGCPGKRWSAANSTAGSSWPTGKRTSFSARRRRSDSLTNCAPAASRPMCGLWPARPSSSSSRRTIP